jgi:rhodanese-related sulfurtransferase
MPIPTVDRPTLLALLGRRDTWLLHADGPGSFRRAHLPGAIRFDTLEHALAVVRQDDRVVVYGPDARSPHAPRWVADLLRHGHERVWWYRDGIAGWQAAGGRIEGTDGSAGRRLRP